MSSTNETGHAVNIGNFKLMVAKVTALGVSYNPSNSLITVVSLDGAWTTAKTAQETLTSAVQAAKPGINGRELAFEGLDGLVTRVMNMFRSSGADREILKDAKGLADKVRGIGIRVERLEDGTPDPGHVSNSQQSYTQRLENFRQFVDLVTADVNYAPNEVDLQATALHTMVDDLRVQNEGIGGVLAPVMPLRVARDEALYGEGTGLIARAKLVKAYVKAVYGASSGEFKDINAVNFRDKP